MWAETSKTEMILFQEGILFVEWKACEPFAISKRVGVTLMQGARLIVVTVTTRNLFPIHLWGFLFGLVRTADLLFVGSYLLRSTGRVSIYLIDGEMISGTGDR